VYLHFKNKPGIQHQKSGNFTYVYRIYSKVPFKTRDAGFKSAVFFVFNIELHHNYWVITSISLTLKSVDANYLCHWRVQGNQMLPV